jgi:hypothetical protein
MSTDAVSCFEELGVSELRMERINTNSTMQDVDVRTYVDCTARRSVAISDCFGTYVRRFYKSPIAAVFNVDML